MTFALIGAVGHVDGVRKSGAEGQAQISEHVQRNLPFPFAREVDLKTAGYVPSDPAAVRQKRPTPD